MAPKELGDPLVQSPEGVPNPTTNAFSRLMAPKPKRPPPSVTATIARRWGGSGRDGLGVYLVRPESHPATSVIYHNADFVAVNDIYPKSSAHTLLLPRDPTRSAQHPFEALQDPEFLAAVRAEVAKLTSLTAKELQRRFGATSAAEARRQAIKVGIHAHPSMSHLHIHVLSREMFSPSLKHRKHYNSFNTPFFVDINDFPLADDDPRLDPDRERYLRRDMVCWRCGKNFRNQFKALKDHLQVEFEEWKHE
ncbi:unnamed protein product [Parascedosporium putredinis]|uniref:HIT domain-containing protein n=1 Tax=Parascedosporium putredinis TaxID=1442378 RepID=A0A9P1GUE6_9PEZI|nr:unnamed protein product [Parascedosporium putredinis]CAI7987301.1 unnamed protein product [Parascedosporium putredinis]